MRVLHDGPGGMRWITVTEAGPTRYLQLDGCEQGAMDLNSEDPVFHYFWFHKCSTSAPLPKRVLVLGAGAFTAAKCLARDHPEADVDAVDEEPALEAIARRFFRLDEPAFGRIRFHALAAEDFLAGGPAPYDFIFNDLFDGFQHVPAAARSAQFIHRQRALLTEGGVCLENLIWNPLSADTRAACEETTAAWREAYPTHGVIVLGDPTGGHNRLLLGRTTPPAFDWTDLRSRLARAGVPGTVLEQSRWLD
jgi:spermidine synthase